MRFIPALTFPGFCALPARRRRRKKGSIRRRYEALEAYDIFQLTGDVVGLVHALGEESAVIVGHDWGALITAYAALFRPDMFRAVALLSVPYSPRGKVKPTEWERQKYPGKVFYQAALRAPGADQFLMSDVRMSLWKGLYSLSGEAEAADRWSPVRDPAARNSCGAENPVVADRTRSRFLRCGI